ncbi:unnamed protein product [Adineta steineri]|uniref:Pentapeptide repeat-containing protein n=2 Tax=Adineta steineri TaxID=433720 RepID=A0A814N9V8_9BILA|nr:unnamed protein product [Adineta steineri]
MALNFIKKNDKHNNTNWCKLFLSALIPCILGTFTIVFTVQQQVLSQQQHEIDRQNQRDAQRETAFNAYINDISNLLLHTNHTNKTIFFLYIRTKTLTVLRSLNPERKKYIILFLYESGLLQGTGLDLSGAELDNVELIGPYKLDGLYLPSTSWENALIVNCSLKKAVFRQSRMPNARFINSLLDAASFAETILDKAYFIKTSVGGINFTSASLIHANFLDAEVVQGINFTNADLLHAQFTEKQWLGQRVSTSAHSFRYARLPNGSFGDLSPTKNLLQNGDAEQKCSTLEEINWEESQVTNGLNIIKFNKTSVVDMNIDNGTWGNCTFVMTTRDARASQNIDLRLYSRLIDLDNAMFSSSAFIGCNGSTNAPYVEISTHELNGNIMETAVYLNHTGNTASKVGMMHQYSIQNYRLLKYTHRARVTLGIRLSQPKNTFCYFDNVTFSMQTRFN